MKLRRVGTALVAVAVAATVSACGSSSTRTGAAASSVASNCVPKYHFKTQTKGVLQAGAITDPPYAEDVNGRVVGIDGTIIAGFARASCLHVQVHVLTYGDAVTSAQTGRVDLAFGDLYRTKQRAQAIGLSSPVYLDELGLVSKAGYTHMQQLQGKTVATEQGDYFNPVLSSLVGSSHVHAFDTAPSMYSDLLAGRAQALIDSYVGALWYLKKTHDTTLHAEIPAGDAKFPGTGSDAAQTVYGYDRADTSLGEAIDQYLAHIRSNGTLADILAKYGVPRSAAKVGAPRFS